MLRNIPNWIFWGSCNHHTLVLCFKEVRFLNLFLPFLWIKLEFTLFYFSLLSKIRSLYVHHFETISSTPLSIHFLTRKHQQICFVHPLSIAIIGIFCKHAYLHDIQHWGFSLHKSNSLSDREQGLYQSLPCKGLHVSR